MSILRKIILIVACAIGVACTVGAIVAYQDTIKSERKTESQKATVGCLFIAFFIFAGALLFVFISLCCPCSDLVLSVTVTVAGAVGCIFSIIAYSTSHRAEIDYRIAIPFTSEWLFGGIVTGVAVFLVALTMVVS
ncbi:hypothetical protein PHET_00593 [Paragonimus heterotremus]|uniref:Uncharacterized protein n=1 Tax=Paragonimus heterotremus TaxID=100268 RepID=A0A8J4TNC4_9TREM|nr:hypothetical protein PHET_00593 [Paragonimus heterotremus]